MAQLIKGVHHICLKCPGVEAFEKTIHFYRDLLGMPVVRSWGSDDNLGIMLSTGDALLEIFSNADGLLPQGAIRHLALATDDVDACVATVAAAGYEITIQPKDIAFATEPPYYARIAFCIGPVGEEVEFFCEK